MQKIIIYTVILVASLVGKVVAQNLNSIEKQLSGLHAVVNLKATKWVR